MKYANSHTPLVRRKETKMVNLQMLRKVEREWLADELGRAISNLGYPVGMGIAPHRDTLLKAADTLFDRYARMIELAQSEAA